MYRSLQLLTDHIHVTFINVSVTQHIDQPSWTFSRQMGHHMHQRRIRKQIERNPQEQIPASLVHLQPQLVPILHVPLTQQVTRWQGHLRQIAGVPRSHQDTTAVRVIENLLPTLFQLVHTTSCIIRMTILVRRTKMPPLKPIHRTQIVLRQSIHDCPESLVRHSHPRYGPFRLAISHCPCLPAQTKTALLRPFSTPFSWSSTRARFGPTNQSPFALQRSTR